MEIFVTEAYFMECYFYCILSVQDYFNSGSVVFYSISAHFVYIYCFLFILKLHFFGFHLELFFLNCCKSAKIHAFSVSHVLEV